MLTAALKKQSTINKRNTLDQKKKDNLDVGVSNVDDEEEENLLQNSPTVIKDDFAAPQPRAPLKMNNAFDQQVITRLNERIKEKKRAMKKMDTPCSRRAKKLYKFTKFTKGLALGWLLLVPFFTKPRWCIEKF